MKYKVYRHVTPSGKSYIGITSASIERRKRNGYAHNPFMRAALKKYGWKRIKTEILADDLELDEANLLEVYYIASFETKDRTKGYNICDGGLTWNSKADDVRRRIAEKATGRICSKESKIKHMLNCQNRKEVRCVETGVVYPSFTAASKAMGCCRNTIKNMVLSGRERNGFHFELVEGREDGES